MTAIAGGCLCGQVRYVARGAPLAVRRCWCRDCQYFGCGSETVNAFFRVEAVEMAGDLTVFESEADSGNAMQRAFCPRCGVQVTTASSARPHLVGLRVGTLDDPSQVTPQGTIWVASAPPWAVFDEISPLIERQPPPA